MPLGNPFETKEPSIEFLFEILVEIVAQAIGELLLELGIESVAQAIGLRRDRAFPIECLGWLLLGVLAGAISALVVPHRVLSWHGPTGISLLLSPLLCGLAMHAIGNQRRQRGRRTSALASFWGGSLFAFGLSGARLLMLTTIFVHS